jgi:hypothetical protein
LSSLEEYLAPVPNIEFEIEDGGIHIFNWRRLKYFDIPLFFLMLILVVIGWINMYSACQMKIIIYLYKTCAYLFLLYPHFTLIDYDRLSIIISAAPFLYIIFIMPSKLSYYLSVFKQKVVNDGYL